MEPAASGITTTIWSGPAGLGHAVLALDADTWAAASDNTSTAAAAATAAGRDSMANASAGSRAWVSARGASRRWPCLDQLPSQVSVASFDAPGHRGCKRPVVSLATPLRQVQQLKQVRGEWRGER